MFFMARLPATGLLAAACMLVATAARGGIAADAVPQPLAGDSAPDALAADWQHTRPANILWVPYATAYSHQKLAVVVGDELARRGHEVFIINSDPCKLLDGKIKATHNRVNQIFVPSPWDWARCDAMSRDISQISAIDGVHYLNRLVMDHCEAWLQDAQLMKFLKSKIEVIVVDHVSFCALAIADYLNVSIRVDFLPVTFMDPYMTPLWGMSSEPSYVPMFDSRLNPPFSFGDRVANIISYAIHMLVNTQVIQPFYDTLRTKYGLDSHPKSNSRAAIVITQMTWMTEIPRPIAPGVKLVGPILAAPGAPLPSTLAAFIDHAPAAGVVLVSFGSLAQPGPGVSVNLLAALGALPFRFVVKVAFPQPADVPPNVHYASWLPQNDVLAHPNVRAFVSHGGLNGIGEATFHGVPVLGVPLFGDQWDNVMRVVHMGMARMVDGKTMSVEDWIAAITDVATNPTMRANARKVRRVVRDDAGRAPLQQAADWIEYGIRHDGALFLRLPTDLRWHQLYCIDVAAALLAVVLAVLLLLWRCCRRLFRRVFSKGGRSAAAGAAAHPKSS